ncbi:hypothetical protein GGE45_002697 [Rhizobium aethiopicum]|uniref:hypothetical protein n=1 Tax=Rhizobium aethiopicum TaxID=1138170 RepID=UPI001620BE7A|nr:hypothetical protein [Rhizobium aethiopicum]MBB4580367.1 hypothetical protein [Rhizobium aethiopicum]
MTDRFSKQAHDYAQSAQPLNPAAGWGRDDISAAFQAGLEIQQHSDLEAMLQQAYQVIGTLLSGPDGELVDFGLPAGQRVLDYFSKQKYDPNFLPFIHPREEQ